MAEYEDGVDAEGGDTVFEGGIDFGGIETAGVAANKEIAHAEIENEFGGSARVGAGEDRNGRGLTKGTRFSDGTFLPGMSDGFASGKAEIALGEGGLGSGHFNFAPGEEGESKEGDEEAIFMGHGVF